MNEEPDEIEILLQAEADAMTLAANNIAHFSPLSLLPPEVPLRIVSHYRNVLSRAGLGSSEGQFLLRGDLGKIAEMLRGQTASLPQLGAARHAVLLHVAFFVTPEVVSQARELWHAIRNNDWEGAHDALMLTDWPINAGLTYEDRKMVLQLARVMRTGQLPFEWTSPRLH